MKLIELTKGEMAQVDDEDYDKVADFLWFCNHGYAKSGRRTWMHRLILNAPPGMDVDHINGDPLDNRRANLRLATRPQNLMNSRKRAGTSSRFKGVYFCKTNPRKPWKANITLKGKYVHLGYFESEEAAAAAYDEAATKHFREYARLNLAGVSNKRSHAT